MLIAKRGRQPSERQSTMDGRHASLLRAHAHLDGARRQPLPPCCRTHTFVHASPGALEPPHRGWTLDQIRRPGPRSATIFAHTAFHVLARVLTRADRLPTGPVITAHELSLRTSCGPIRRQCGVPRRRTPKAKAADRRFSTRIPVSALHAMPAMSGIQAISRRKSIRLRGAAEMNRVVGCSATETARRGHQSGAHVRFVADCVVDARRLPYARARGSSLPILACSCLYAPHLSENSALTAAQGRSQRKRCADSIAPRRHASLEPPSLLRTHRRGRDRDRASCRRAIVIAAHGCTGSRRLRDSRAAACSAETRAAHRSMRVRTHAPSGCVLRCQGEHPSRRAAAQRAPELRRGMTFPGTPTGPGGIDARARSGDSLWHDTRPGSGCAHGSSRSRAVAQSACAAHACEGVRDARTSAFRRDDTCQGALEPARLATRVARRAVDVPRCT
ncbi:hypothetical protein WOLCODRAFT_167268 [Wolfiporia cocos MD-104 SS10]|uniref:Uncharacterized protein n=1 Tax=Wolfiporia cocos (strain MD-104) TaxID=742152 RepID=A0A2H3J456_WOLCO|nr:hypothetical protein WOLCODRAFT_167268 [Wolfiporia cocos MD-104 SS10]